MRELTCIVCPNGCELTVEDDGRVDGNLCKKGLDFAREELTNPQRVVTSSVKTIFSDCPVISCRTKQGVPKGKIPEVMAEIRKVCVQNRICCGSIVIENVAGTGVNVITTKDM